MTTPLMESFENRAFTNEDLYGVRTRGGWVSIRYVYPELIDFIRHDLMKSEGKGMEAPEELWRRLSRFRQERAADPGWAAFFRGVDYLPEENWQAALTELHQSRAIFLGRNDVWATHLTDGFIRDTEILRQKEKETGSADGPVASATRQMMDDELLWQWWRITHLPWE
jgi:hypothetical protein